VASASICVPNRTSAVPVCSIAVFRPLEFASVFAAASWKVLRDLIRTGEDLNMWLFTGRYAHLGAAICLIALVVASVCIVFITTAVRPSQRRDLKVSNIVNVLLVAIPASLLGYAVGCGEPVFVSDNLNLGMALFVAVAGIVLGLIAVTLSNKLRPLRVLVLFASAAMLFGDLTGWILRSAAPSKYTSPAGFACPAVTSASMWAFLEIGPANGTVVA
jgi:hypothetical protein